MARHAAHHALEGSAKRAFRIVPKRPGDFTDGSPRDTLRPASSVRKVPDANSAALDLSGVVGCSGGVIRRHEFRRPVIQPMPEWFDEHREQQRALRERASLEPVVEVTGIIAAPGVGWSQMRGDPWEEVVIFDVWRVGNGPFEFGELRLVQEVVGDDLAFGSLKGMLPETVITTKARVLGADDGAFGIVAGHTSVVEPDTAFIEALKRQKSPATFDDPQLGGLTAHPILGWVGEAEWLGENCSLSITHVDDLATAHALWGEQRRWTIDAVNLAAERLIGLKNSNWLADGEPPVSIAEFRARIKLTSISVGKDGAFVFYFDDGDLFWDHTIVIEGNLRDGLTKASLAG